MHVVFETVLLCLGQTCCKMFFVFGDQLTKIVLCYHLVVL